ncbi:MAG: phospholipase A [Burkholderiaceae bacterium]
MRQRTHLLSAALAALCLHAAAADAQSVSSGNPETSGHYERCLLEQLAEADPGLTVGALRAACREADVGGPVVSADLGQPVALLPESGQPVAPELPAGPAERRIASEARLWSERFALLPHRPNYLLPVTYSEAIPGSSGASERFQRTEVKFQVSFKFALLPPLFEDRAGLFFAYTGQAWWQAYNNAQSAPFREYSHEPEVFLAMRPGLPRIAGWTPRLATVGFNHQSNGRRGESSRSWNRLFAELVLDRPDGLWLAVRPWWRIPESARSDPGSSRGDDNPEIERYAGDFELRLGRELGRSHWTLSARRGLRSAGKGSVQLDWSRPTGFSPQLRWHVQYFDGYGESLLDYRRRVQRIGLGVMLNDWY